MGRRGAGLIHTEQRQREKICAYLSGVLAPSVSYSYLPPCPICVNLCQSVSHSCLASSTPDCTTGQLEGALEVGGWLRREGVGDPGSGQAMGREERDMGRARRRSQVL